jgi:hypothetical protein
MDSFMLYNGLPVGSGGGHRVNKNFLEVYTSISFFLEQYSNNPDSYNVDIIFAPGHNGSGLKMFCRLCKHFGFPRWAFCQYIATKNSSFAWFVGKGNLNKAMQLTDNFPGLTLSIAWRFRFTDPVSKLMLPEQDKIPVIDKRMFNSQVYLRSGNPATVSVWFTIPFNPVSNADVAYLKLIKRDFPIKLSTKHWKIWKKSKKGTWASKNVDIDELLQVK